MENKVVWRDIPGWEHYQASNTGEIKSKARTIAINDLGRRFKCERRIKEKILKKIVSTGGYHYVNLYPGAKCIKVQYLVLLAFIGERPEGLLIRHLDGNPVNNHVDNLKYGTATENRLDATKHDSHKISNQTKLQIIEDTGSSRQLARKYGVSRAYVRLLKRDSATYRNRMGAAA